VKNPIRNETSLVLVIAVIFSGVAIPVLSGFLEPSQPPAVAAVQIGDPSGRDAPSVKPRSAPQHKGEDNSAGKGEANSAGEDDDSAGKDDDSAGEDESNPAGDVRGRRSMSSSRERPAQPAEPAPAPPADDAGEDDDAD
jgi:hypothetical protein